MTETADIEIHIKDRIHTIEVLLRVIAGMMDELDEVDVEVSLAVSPQPGGPRKFQAQVGAKKRLV